jgi:hypothetical protein
LLLGAIALVAARKRHVGGFVALGLTSLTAAAAWEGALQSGPSDPGEPWAHLMDARDVMDVDRRKGCEALANVMSNELAWDPEKGPLPPQVRATVPDYDEVATKCARWDLAEGNTEAIGRHSPLLVDAAFRAEVMDDVDLHPCWFGCAPTDGDEEFGGYPVLGLAPKHNEVRFLTEARTESGPTDYPPKVLRRIVARALTRIRLRRCAETTPGNGTVTLTVERSGKVISVAPVPMPSEEGGPAITNPEVVACVVHAMEALTFPPPEGTVTITFPIAFDAMK